MPESEPSDPSGDAVRAKRRLSAKAPPKPHRRGSSIPPALVATKTAARIAPAPPRPPRPPPRQLTSEAPAKSIAEAGEVPPSSRRTPGKNKRSQAKGPKSVRARAAAPTTPAPSDTSARRSLALPLLLGFGIVGAVLWYTQRPAEPGRSNPTEPAIAANTAEPEPADQSPEPEAIRTIDLDELEPAPDSAHGALANRAKNSPDSDAREALAAPMELAPSKANDEAPGSNDSPAPGDNNAAGAPKPDATETAANSPAAASAAPAKDAPAPDTAALPPFDAAAAKVALGASANQASSCRKGDDPRGTAEVLVTFAPSGRVTSANVSGAPFGGTQTGGCIASMLRQATVPPFSGKYVTVRKLVKVR